MQVPWENWDFLAEAVGREPGTPRADAANAAVSILRHVLGEQWLGEGWVPPELALAFSHSAMFAQMLEIALRLREFGHVPGAAAVRKSLRTDRTVDRWRHAQIQLELASLFTAAGDEVEFERGPLGGWPADVLVRDEAGFIAVEAFAVFTSETWRDAARESEEISQYIRNLESERRLSIVTDFHATTLSPSQLERWLREITAAAAEVAGDSAPRTVTCGAVTCEIAPRDQGLPSRFSGPPIVANPWPRIVRRIDQKRRQASSSTEPIWLRVDLLEGMFQFSRWAQLPLPQKLDVLEQQLRHEFGHISDLAGLVISTGAAQAQGTFANEDASTHTGAIGLRRNLRPVRVRETLIVPFQATAREAARRWALSYDREPESLERSLRRATLETLDAVFG